MDVFLFRMSGEACFSKKASITLKQKNEETVMWWASEGIWLVKKEVELQRSWCGQNIFVLFAQEQGTLCA